IKTDAPARFDEDALRRRPPNIEALTELAAQLEFRTLLERIRKQAGAAEESGGADGKAAAGSPPEPAAAGAEVVREAGALERACALLARAEEPLVVAALASDEDAMRADIIGVLLADRKSVVEGKSVDRGGR